jgi:hypothetical protein
MNNSPAAVLANGFRPELAARFRAAPARPWRALGPCTAIVGSSRGVNEMRRVFRDQPPEPRDVLIHGPPHYTEEILAQKYTIRSSSTTIGRQKARIGALPGP